MNLHTVVHLPLDKAIEVKRLEYTLAALQSEMRRMESAGVMLEQLRERRRRTPVAELPLLDRMIEGVKKEVRLLAESHFSVILLKRALREARKERDILYEKRSWLLVEGELRGEWVQCARSHDCYTDDTRRDRWFQEPLLGRFYWLCSSECRSVWRAREIERLDKGSVRTVEITWEGGKKSLLRTTGTDRDGTHQTPRTESV